MPKIVYPYTQFQIPPSAPYPAGQLAWRPMAIATLTTPGGESLRCLVCIDTGADACIFPLAIAIALKIDVLSLPKTMTAGVGSSSNVTYYANMTVDIGNGISFPVYAGFTEGMNASGLGLLGQADFFSIYDVHFSHKKRVFTIDVPDV
jgi:hypothetical protein